MIQTAYLSLGFLLCCVVLTLLGWGTPLAVVHIAFVLGVVPLIFSAMIHFVPVLTRTGEPGRLIGRIPWAAQLIGIITVLAMQGIVARWILLLAVLAELLLSALLLNWMAGRARASLGSPHPGWRWYGVALGCLMMALAAILLQGVWPSYWRALRLFHLHLNTIGLVGLAALGTLPVLMPTILGLPDPQATVWLRRRLWLVAGGAIVIATGAAIVWPFGVPGAALVLVAALGLLGHWFRRFGAGKLLADGASITLLGAVLGLVVTLIAGVAHGAGMMSARLDLLAWGVGFLLPLVSGVLSQLLPVWRWPGPASPARHAMRARLVANGRWRAVFCMLSAILLLLDYTMLAAMFLLAVGLFFIFNLLQAIRVAPASR